MFIQTEATPNPQVMKFLPGQTVNAGGAREFVSVEEAENICPMAEKLLAVEGIVSVFLGSDFVSVTKAGEKDWLLLKPAVLGAIMEQFTSGQPMFLDQPANDGSDASEDDDEVVVQIKALLDERVRPAVAKDGGDIVYQSFQNGVLFLEMRGACSGCPSAGATLKMGIENMMKHYIPEVVEVRQAL